MILTNYAIKFRTAVAVFTVVVILAGASAYVSLPREGPPDITFPVVFVSAYYDGTAPEEMEKLITIPIEKQLNDVEGIKEVRSTSAENIATFVIEFQSGDDIDLAKQRVKDKLDLARPDLPDDLDEPVVDAFNISSDFPILVLALSGETEPERLKNLAEDLQDQIELLSGVKEASLSGIREREIRVEIDLPRLIAYDVPLSLVMGRIAQENRTISAGNIELAGDKFQVRIPGEFKAPVEMRDILLTTREGRPVYLTDVAVITDTYKDLESISRLNGKPSVSLSCKKRPGENTVALARKIRGVTEHFRLPPGIELTAVMDQSIDVHMMLKELENNIFSGFVLVVAILLFFMGTRNSLFVALAIPLSMLLGFIALSAMGQTLNMIVLFSLVLAVGMLVDNAVVIVENIYRNRTLGLTRHEAARAGASEVAWPVITSTLTTLAAFSPLLFWPDVMGEFMGYLPRTLIVVLTASLFVALVINPAICSVFIEGRPRDKREQPHPFVAGYERTLRGALRHSGTVLALGFAFLVLSALIYAKFGRGLELFPEVEPRNAQVEVKFPQGTSIERTDAALRAIEERLPKYEDIKFYLTSVGQGVSSFMGGGGSGTHIGSILIQFVDIAERKADSTELVNRIRDDIGVIAGAEVRVEKEEEGPPTGAPVSIELSGDDFDTLSDLAAEIRRAIETVPGLVDLQDNLEDALPEIQFHVDRKRAALLGLDTDSIGTFLRMSVYGLEVSKFRADEDEYDITLRLPADQRNTMNLLDQVFIPVAGGGTVPLSSLGRAVYTGGRGAITRKHQKRLISITGNNQGRGVDEILADVRPRIERIHLPRGYSIQYTGDTEEMNEAFEFLSRAFLIAVGLILVILVIEFNSAILPLIIVFTVLLSSIGVMWGLLICRMKFGVIMTGVGVVSLAGIVVNNAIVLVDCILQKRRDGLDAVAAAVAAGHQRLRPVLLTAGTTVLGLIPMAVGWSVDVHCWPPCLVAGAESSQWWAPMAIAVIFGLALATILTLVIVPAMYCLADSVATAARRRIGVTEE
ncbi:MAG: efflux RND transporter permease subunit [Kiritimatiellae bacterium]|nr:efflux RND transporter permease subunit [Kiritimatiellia bacterium]